MTRLLDAEDDIAARLRTLAAAAAPAVTARPTLGSVAVRQAKAAGRRRAVTVAVGSIAMIAAVAAATLPGRGAYFTVIQPSENMAPTVQVGDAVLLGKELTAVRGDVVQARITDDGVEFDAIQRVIGLPGDTVECPAGVDGTCAAVVVNGAPLTEPYLAEPTEPFAAEVVPPGEVFLLGDHRSLAVDSREVGPTGLDQIIGVAVRIDRDGTSLAVPGAPVRAAPGAGDNVDPAGDIPPAAVK